MNSHPRLGLVLTALAVALTAVAADSAPAPVPVLPPAPPAPALATPPAEAPKTSPNFTGLDKVLQFATGPQGADSRARTSATRGPGRGAPGNFDPVKVVVLPPLPVYSFDIQSLVNGLGLASTRTNGQFSYIVENNGEAVAEIGMSADAAGNARAGMISYAQRAGPNGTVSNGAANILAGALAHLQQMAASGQLAGGPYEPRYIRSQPPIALSAIWLKAKAGGSDLIIPIGSANPNMKMLAGLEDGKLYSGNEFLKVFVPYLQNRMGLPTGPTEWTTEAQMHDYFVKRFIASNGFGADRMPSPLMSLDEGMKLTLPGAGGGAASSYKIGSFELIGIAMHPTPVAFDTKQHAAANAASTSTRDLTAFEKKALDQLRAGHDTYAEDDSTGEHLVVGAIRAQQTCLRCHPGLNTGDLLGAFSYHLSLTDLRNIQTTGRGGSN